VKSDEGRLKIVEEEKEKGEEKEEEQVLDSCLLYCSFTF
jgi:hypothetical protein